jgi:hypothetical protein
MADFPPVQFDSRAIIVAILSITNQSMVDNEEHASLPNRTRWLMMMLVCAWS